MESIKNAFKNRTFRVYFAICFALATPIFIKIAVEDIDAGKMNLLHGSVMVLQYLFCIVSLPNFFSKQRQ